MHKVLLLFLYYYYSPVSQHSLSRVFHCKNFWSCFSHFQCILIFCADSTVVDL